MNKLLGWIDRTPLGVLVAMTAWMLVAPIVPEPHLIEKWRMLRQGTLTRPIDLFDVVWHLLPAALLALHLWRMRASTGKS
jgi:hypothetical protein